MKLATRLYDLFHHCFQQFHQTKFLAFCLLVFCSSFFCYWVLLNLKQSGRRVPFGKFLFVNADKSLTNALQIGGLPFSIISLFSIGLLFYWFPYLINENQGKILHYATYSWIGILFYGYLDDHYEIRPIVKLSFQLFLVSVFCLNTAKVVLPTDSAIAFLIMSFFSLAVLNGTNLIDGIDTLSIKVSAVIYLSFILLSANIMSLPTLFVATSCFFIMASFYFFNREPSRIHLGEVGVSCLGFSYIVLAVLIYEGYSKFNPPIYSLSKALVPVVIVLVEVGLSFVRRILAGKSPFRGDRLHLHHILQSVHQFSASATASILAGAYLLFVSFAFFLMDPFSSIVSFLALLALCLSWSVLIGRKHWFSGEIQLNIFDALLVKEDVRIIPSNSLSEFRIVLTKPEIEE